MAQHGAVVIRNEQLEIAGIFGRTPARVTVSEIFDRGDYISTENLVNDKIASQHSGISAKNSLDSLKALLVSGFLFRLPQSGKAAETQSLRNKSAALRDRPYVLRQPSTSFLTWRLLRLCALTLKPSMKSTK